MKQPRPVIRVAAVVSAVGLATLFVLYRGGVFAAPQPAPINDPVPTTVIDPEHLPTMISSSKTITFVTPVVPTTGFKFETTIPSPKSGPIFAPPEPPPPRSAK